MDKVRKSKDEEKKGERMESDIKLLRVKIFEKDLSISKLAKEMSMGRDTLANKMKNRGENLKLKDIHFLAERLALTDDEILDTFFIRKEKR